MSSALCFSYCRTTFAFACFTSFFNASISSYGLSTTNILAKNKTIIIITAPHTYDHTSSKSNIYPTKRISIITAITIAKKHPIVCFDAPLSLYTSACASCFDSFLFSSLFALSSLFCLLEGATDSPFSVCLTFCKVSIRYSKMYSIKKSSPPDSSESFLPLTEFLSAKISLLIFWLPNVFRFSFDSSCDSSLKLFTKVKIAVFSSYEMP